VFDKENEGGVVLFAKEQMNLTDQVVAELDRMSAAEGAATPAPKADPNANPKANPDGSPGKSP